jgi:hypothetical protein
MGLGDLISQNILGGVEKAVIAVVEPPSGASSALGGALGVALGGALGGALGRGLSAATASLGKTLEVQFNPSSLRLSASAVTMPIKLMAANIADIPNQASRKASIVMNVELIFDQVKPHDAFTTTEGGLSSLASGVGYALASAATEAITGKGKPSVFEQTNAFIGFIANAEQKMLSFNWGNFSFDGYITDLQIKYKMFANEGRPLRSTVAMTVIQSIGADLGDPWKKAYSDFFKDDTSGIVGQIAGAITGKLFNT